MRIHHAKVHGERLPNRTCEDCGTQFYDPKSQRKYCGNGNPNAGRNNGNRNDAKATADCRSRGGAFEFDPSDKKGVYGSTCVENHKGCLGTPYDEAHDIRRVTRRCEECDEEMVLLESYVNQRERNGRFCSHECRCLAMKESSHENSYNSGWAELRRKALRGIEKPAKNAELTSRDWITISTCITSNQCGSSRIRRMLTPSRT